MYVFVHITSITFKYAYLPISLTSVCVYILFLVYAFTEQIDTSLNKVLGQKKSIITVTVKDDCYCILCL